MAIPPFNLINRFRLATFADVPALRTFFAQQLEGGGAWFDAVNPYAHQMLGVCFPLADLWLVTIRRKVVAAGWFHLQPGGQVQVVALTAPEQDKFTDPLLAYIEAALQVIAHERRALLTQVTALVPHGAHRQRLEAAYIRRGWSRLEPNWWAHLHRAHLRRDVLTQIVQGAQAAGLVIQAERDLRGAPAQAVARLRHSLRDPDRIEELACAVQDDHLMAVNSVEHHDEHGRVLTTAAHWLTTHVDQRQVDLALTAATLLHRPTLPDLLTGTGDIAPFQAWFTGVLDVEQPISFTLPLEAARPPTPYELAMGLNPNRIWMIRGVVHPDA